MSLEISTRSIQARPMTDPVVGGASSASVLPAPDSNCDALADLYASILKQQASGAKNDSQTARQVQGAKDAAVKIDQYFLNKLQPQDDHRGMFGAVFHVFGTIISDAEKLHVKDMVTDTEHNVSKDIWNNPQFWSDFKEAAEVVGEAAAAVGGTLVTFGAGAVAVAAIAVALSVASSVDGHLHLLEKAGVSSKAACYIDMGCALTSAVLTFGASISSTASAAATSAEALSKQTAQTAARACTLVQASSEVSQGAATLRQGDIEAEHQDLSADELGAANKTKRLEAMVEWIVDGMKETQKSNERVLSTVSQAMQTQQATSSALTSFGKA